MGRYPLDRWLLVNYAGYPFAPNSLFPDNGLANLAAVLLERGHKATILDYATVPVLAGFTDPLLAERLTRTWTALAQTHAKPGLWRKAGAAVRLHGAERARAKRGKAVLRRAQEEILERIAADGIQAVGFKLWNGDGIDGSLAMARAVRRRFPDVRLVGGGPMVDVFMEHILERHREFDVLVYGEGEETIGELAARGGDAGAWPEIPNLLFRRGATVERTAPRVIADLDTLPMPVYDSDVYPAMAGDQKIKIVVLDESRGCRNHCAFCIHPVKSRHTLRVKSIERLGRETAHLAERYSVRTFRFAGSCTPYSLLNAFAASPAGRGQGFRYASFAHVREAGEADFDLMRHSGCEALFFGVESGSQTILNGMRKGIRADAVPGVVARARAAGIFTVASLIYPAPGDTAATAAETLELLRRAAPDAVTLQPALITPRTDWFEHAERYGITFQDKARYIETGLHWKAKLLMPPAFWAPLPVRVNGRSFTEMLRQTGELARRIEALGIPTSISDDTYLMSSRAGMSTRVFRDTTRRLFFAGDAAGVQTLVSRINRAVAQPGPLQREGMTDAR
ncbi:MAG: cobalamin-dependent protein [Lentisphaerae bacterium]|nr:cobalamin-dependent protein [Lentisphaerota bacterium]